MAMTVYLGCNADSDHPEGIYALSVDSRSGAVEILGSRKLLHAVYMVRSCDGKYVYSCSDAGLASFAVDGSGLSPVDSVSLPGGACHVSAMPDGHSLAWAEYMGGTCGSVEVSDGRFGKAVVHRHAGSGPNLPRQAGPHCHQAIPAPDGKGYFVVDLGLDSIFAYPGGSQFNCVPPGAGPRHLLFHPDGRLAFLVYELGNFVSSLSWSPVDGFRQLDMLPTLTESNNSKVPFFHDSTVPCSAYLAAAIRFTPDGKSVVVSNRGENSLAVFDFDESDGKLAFKARTMLEGNWPRDFDFIGPDMALVAFERSGEVQTLRYDSASGLFSPLAKIGGFYRPLAVMPAKSTSRHI